MSVRRHTTADTSAECTAGKDLLIFMVLAHAHPNETGMGWVKMYPVCIFTISRLVDVRMHPPH